MGGKTLDFVDTYLVNVVDMYLVNVVDMFWKTCMIDSVPWIYQIFGAFHLSIQSL